MLHGDNENMSFSFNFASEEIDSDDEQQVGVVTNDLTAQGKGGHHNDESTDTAQPPPRSTAKRHSLEEMLATLPSKISYSRVDVINRTNSTPTALFRRDLFDARFQMIHEDEDEDEEKDETDQPRQPNDTRWKDAMAGAATDLVPGVYEGGLKTWECSLDLASVLSDKLAEQPDLLRGSKTVLELGCGTAVPSLFLFSKALQSNDNGGAGGEREQSLTLQLCDFNEQVLRLVTVPNFILTWYFHSRGNEVSSVKQSGDEGEDKDDDDSDEDVLELNEEVLGAFKSALQKHRITLELFSGHWSGLQNAQAYTAERRPDIILTSETIYSMDTMPSLVDTLDEAMNGTLEDAVRHRITLEGDAQQTQDKKREPQSLCLVAAKVLYFGVGGGVYAFEQELRRRRAHADTIWKSDRGVARAVLQVRWQ